LHQETSVFYIEWFNYLVGSSQQFQAEKVLN